ncbi:hypothetical protein [Nonomuraea sp. NPDC049684]|uniref:hypothetical protein n=1 Tax=Nonomuraea sp. NPDC049684 TaxID=3364356 RepID=UPI0037922268
MATFSSDGHRLAITYGDRVELRDGSTGQCLPGPPPLHCPVTASEVPAGCLVVAAFRRDGRVLAYSDILQTPPFRAWLWDLDGRRLSATSPPLQDGKSLAFAGDSILIGGNPILGNDASHLSKTIV